MWGYGDVWTWTAIDAGSKLVPAWLVAPRTADAAQAFMADLAGRLANRVQLTTDGNTSYLMAVERSFGAGVDYSQLVKLYGDDGSNSPEQKYSPGECCGTRRETIMGSPDEAHVNTSFFERLNLSLRQTNKRMARLTSSFSRKVENLQHSLALGFMVYNFVKIHGSLRVTPAMEAGICESTWEYEDVVALLERDEPTAKDVGALRKDRRSN